MDPITALALATGAVKLGMDLFTYIEKQREIMKQNNEWTQEMEVAWDKAQEERKNAYYYKPHA